MFLTDDKPKIELTPKAELLLDVLKANKGKWLNRAQLADGVNKNRLNPNDINQLSNMADAGIIAIRKQPITGVIPYQWEYRFSEDKS